MEDEEYPFLEDEEKIDETYNPKCRCPDLTCPRHSNCKACKEFHNKKYELTYCRK